MFRYYYYGEYLKPFEDLTLDEKANAKRLYGIAKGKSITANITYKASDIEELREMFRFRTCEHIRGIYTVFKYTKFVKYIYIPIPKTPRKGTSLL